MLSNLDALVQTYLLVCVGRDNRADHRSCWDLHCFYCGDRRHCRHGSWDSGYRSSQNFLLKPGGTGHQSSGPCTNSGTLAISSQRLHPYQHLLTPAPTISRFHFSMIKPYVGPIAAWKLQGLAALALGRFLSRPVAGLTEPSPPPSPSDVLRRSCPECWRQGPGPRVLLHPGVPGAAPLQPSLLPSPSPLPPGPPPVPLSTLGVGPRRAPADDL